MKKEKWRAKDYVVIPRSILTQKISPSALRLWIALASFCYDDDKCWPSNRAILERMPEGTALNTVKTAKRELEKAQLIKRSRRFADGRETSSIYELLAPVGTELLEGGNEMVTHGVEAVTHEGVATVTPLNKNKRNKKEEDVLEKPIKKTANGEFVFDEDEGQWVEEG